MKDIIDEIWKARHPYDAIFLELIDGYEIKYHRENTNSYMKNGVVILNYNKKTNFTYIDDSIWEVFIKYNLDYNQIVELLSSMLENHLGLVGTKPFNLSD